MASAPVTTGSSAFDPDQLITEWNASKLPVDNDLRTSIINTFSLDQNDDYVYHAIASVTLSQVQSAINAGNANGMLAWYRDEHGKQIDAPSRAEIDAYTNIFSPSSVTTKAISAYAGNVKKGSIGSSVAEHLQSKLHLPTKDSGFVLPGKQKSGTRINPYLDFWAWSCQCLAWAGPNDSTVNVKQAHHVLPIFYHHFGCIVPTYDALSLISQLARPPKKKGELQVNRPVLDIGSGNGYWTYLLRRIGLTVHAVDNALSAWRTMWIPDTITRDAIAFLGSPQKIPSVREAAVPLTPGCPEAVLLLVYPQVSHDFTGKVIHAYRGDWIVVAGTQNGNGYTGFRDEVIDAWMERTRPEFQKCVQIPLPSFAGKDEALFVFVRKGKET